MRHTQWILAVALLVAGPAWANPGAGVQGAQSTAKAAEKAAEPERSEPRRPWKFWIGESRTELGLTAQQAADIEEIFQSTMLKLESLKQKVDSLEATASQTIKDGRADLAVVTQQVDRFEAARAELSKTRTLMLYRMRKLLTPDQLVKLEGMMERWEAARRKNQDSGRR